MLTPPWLYADACEYQTSALFFSYSDTITFYYLPLIIHVMINLALILLLHLREMIRGCKLCDSLIHLFLPLSLSCSPSFRTVTYGRQLCREPQSVFTLSCTLSHTAAQLPTLLRACSSLPASSHVSFHSFFFLCDDPTPLLHASSSPAAALLVEVRWTVNGLWSTNSGAHHCHWAGLQHTFQ